MSAPTTHATLMPDASKVRLQRLLDEADRAWFSRNPTATHRVRFHFRNEQVEPGKSAQRFVRVTIEAGVLVRRYHAGEGALV